MLLELFHKDFLLPLNDICMKMRLVIILLFFFLNGYTQKRDDDYKKMIDSAISIKAIQLFELAPKTINGSISKTSLYLINEDDLPYKYSSTFENIIFRYIDVYKTKNKKILKKGIFAWKILTSLKNDTFIVTIIDFTITYKKRNYKYANGGGAKTTFQYSCQENKWILRESTSSGI